MQQQWHRFPKKPLQFKRILCYLTIGVMNIDQWSCKFHFSQQLEKCGSTSLMFYYTAERQSVRRQDVVPRTGLSHETKLPTPHKQDQTGGSRTYTKSKVWRWDRTTKALANQQATLFCAYNSRDYLPARHADAAAAASPATTTEAFR